MGWFPVSRIFYVRYVRKGNAWKDARKRKSWTSLNFSFEPSTFYLSSISFTWLKFTYVAKASVAKHAPVEINLLGKHFISHLEVKLFRFFFRLYQNDFNLFF